MSIALGLDLSTVRTGYCFGGVDDSAPRGGVWKLPGSKPEVLAVTLGRLADSIITLHKLVKFTHVAIEAPIMPSDGMTNASTITALMQLTGAARASVFRCGATEHLVAVNTVRKHFIGKGNLPSAEAKAQTVRRCELLGWSVVDDNHADACATWAWCMASFFPKWAPKSTPLFGGARAGGQQ
jgi:Holliday junction resolvasome RuvABC endonuclease subunit